MIYNLYNDLKELQEKMNYNKLMPILYAVSTDISELINNKEEFCKLLYNVNVIMNKYFEIDYFFYIDRDNSRMQDFISIHRGRVS